MQNLEEIEVRVIIKFDQKADSNIAIIGGADGPHINLYHTDG